MTLLAADRDIVARAADKIATIEFCRTVKVAAPDAVVVPAYGRNPAQSICAELGADHLVVQRAPNNLIGRGTVRVRGAAELGEALAAWPGEPLKVSRFQSGVPVTVSGCVAADATVVSLVGQQLVGLDELGAGWGTHCGNQLLGPEDLPAYGYRDCRAVCHAVGEELRARGYRGTFGIDAVVDSIGQAWLIEINPRFQTVVSLVQAAEVASGVLPMLGVHVLAHLTELGPLLPDGHAHWDANRCPGPRTEHLTAAQMVVHFTEAGRVAQVPASGCYRLHADGLLRRTASKPIVELADEEALLWAHACDGDPVSPGDEAVLLQFGQRIATVAETPTLNREAGRWIAAVRPAVSVVQTAAAVGTQP